jgi:hypothetical protein
LWVWFVFSIAFSLSWLGYQGLYIHEQLAGSDFSALSPSQMAVYAALVAVPIWIVWQIFGFAVQFFQTKKTDRKLAQMLEQGKKNQDYTDLIVRVMLEAEHEIKDGFVINKFDVFISDINEILADVVIRSNCASSMQLEQLWGRVKNGERWVIGKTLVEAAKRQNDFAGYLIEKARKDSVFKGTLLEFCARYQDLSALLEKHDRDRIFINIMETGVLGRVYALLAPAVDDENLAPTPTISVSDDRTDEAESGFTAPFLNMPEPETEKESSFWSRLNPFSRAPEESQTVEDEDLQNDHAFFETLHQNLNASSDESNADEPIADESPRFETYREDEDTGPSLSGRSFDESDKEPAFDKADYMPAPTLSTSEPEKTSKKSSKDDFAYPFGGWIDEKNYK